MRFYLTALLAVLLLPGVVQAKRTYYYELDKVSELNGEELARKFPRLEVYGDGVLSFGHITDGNGDTLSGRMVGGRGGVLLGIGYGIMLGAELEQLKANDQRTDYLSTFRRRSWQAVVRWVCTPDTNISLYLLAGFGEVRQDTHFGLKNYELAQHSKVISAGMGGDLPLWSALHLKLEYRLMYDVKRWENFMVTAPRVRQELSAGLVVAF